MRAITSTILQSLTQPKPASHKGQNGRVLVIAGSEKFHGAMLLVVQAASRLVDMVYVYSTDDNLELIESLRSKIAVFIGVQKKELKKTLDLVGSIVIGPGLETTNEKGEEVSTNIESLVHMILSTHSRTPTVIDATAFWHVHPEDLHETCIATPHAREFSHVFDMEATPQNVQRAAASFGGIVVLTGQTDYISDGEALYENTTGNVGMTKGGTGDALAGVIGALAATNDPLTAACAGAYLTGAAGDALYEKTQTFYNAEDVVEEMGNIFGQIRK
jgi:ADP-dependent NAD(P)H-hydrate dehydratase / NAD(P)H-hydrate epimerase